LSTPTSSDSTLNLPGTCLGSFRSPQGFPSMNKRTEAGPRVFSLSLRKSSDSSTSPAGTLSAEVTSYRSMSNQL